MATKQPPYLVAAAIASIIDQTARIEGFDLPPRVISIMQADIQDLLSDPDV